MQDKVGEGVVGYKVETETTCTKGKDDYWTVEQIITQSRKMEGKDWEKKSVSMRATDKLLERATDMTATSLMIYLDSLGGDLFTEDKSDLPEGKGGYIQ